MKIQIPVPLANPTDPAAQPVPPQDLRGTIDTPPPIPKGPTQGQGEAKSPPEFEKSKRPQK